MGLIKVFTKNVYSYIGDLWENYVCCETPDDDTIVKRGHTRLPAGTGNSADENLIVNGSRIAVDAGQVLIVVENGRIIDFTAEQGGYEFAEKAEPSAFCGDMGAALAPAAEEVKRRSTSGGAPGADRRAYFINVGELMGNRFGFGKAPYRDKALGLTVLMQGYGTYSFRIVDPVRFYENICASAAEEVQRDAAARQLRVGLQSAMPSVLGELSSRGVSCDQVSMQPEAIWEFLKENLSHAWRGEYGAELMSIAFLRIGPDDESAARPHVTQEPKVTPAGRTAPTTGTGDTWICSCGMVNSMRFCPNCGSKKPEPKKCPDCGLIFPGDLSDMNFCPNCGRKIDK